LKLNPEVDDGGMTIAAWELARRLDDAREEFDAAGQPRCGDGISQVVAGLADALGKVPPPGPEKREPGWSARRRRG
jgi:hypothetical protein